MKSKSNVTQLPVQHASQPHCPQCKRDFPSVFDSAQLLLPGAQILALQEFTLIAFALKIRCPCGVECTLEKNVESVHPIEVPT